MSGKHAQPARGALAGIRQDAQAAKDGKYDPRGTGTAWSHNFLNQKPWHPLNFRNQARVFEAEQQKIDAEKKRAQGKAEFEAEQEYMKTLSYLSPEEQRKYQERQSIAFMYMKPPGLAAEERRASNQDNEAPSTSGAADSAQVPAGPSQPQLEEQQQQRRPRQDADGRGGLSKGHVAGMLGAVAALQQQEKWQLKHIAGMGSRSPPRGGLDPQANNQAILVSDSDAEDKQDMAAGVSKEDRKLLKLHKKQLKKQQLKEAKAFLRAAGLEPEAAARNTHDKQKKKHKKSK